MVLDSHVRTPLGLQAQEALVTPLVTELGRPNQLNEWRTIRLVDLVAVTASTAAKAGLAVKRSARRLRRSSTL